MFTAIDAIDQNIWISFIFYAPQKQDRIVGRRHVGFKCIAKKKGWKGKGKKAIVVTCNNDSTYDVELIDVYSDLAAAELRAKWGVV